MGASSKQRSRQRPRPAESPPPEAGHAGPEADERAAGPETVVLEGEIVPEGPPEEAPAWRERAAFRVSVDYWAGADEPLWRTRAYHEESDSAAEWAGPPGPALLEWLGAQGELPALAAEPERPAAEPEPPGPPLAPAEEPYPALAMGELWLAEVLIEEELGVRQPPRIGPSYSRRVRSQLGFAVDNAAGIAATVRQAPYVVQVLCCDIATGEQRVLAEERQQLRPFVDRYSSVSEFNLPDVGRYRVLATVLLPDEGVAGLAVGPVLTVVR